MRTALERMVEALEREPETPVRAIDVMPETERRRVLVEWNATEQDYSKESCVHELIEAQAERNPDAIALIHDDLSLTYGELNTQANRFAHHLREIGVGPDARVAICVERGIEMVVALLATLKAGGAYVPLDPAYPPDRLAYMLEDSAPMRAAHPRCGQSETYPVTHSVPTLNLDGDAALVRPMRTNPDHIEIGLDGQRLAYIIYTSGSTGLPKGVMVEHGGLCNLVFSRIRAFDMRR